MVVGCRKLFLETGDFFTQLVDDFDLRVDVLSRNVRNKRGLHCVIERAKVLFNVGV